MSINEGSLTKTTQKSWMPTIDIEIDYFRISAAAVKVGRNQGRY